ALLQAKGVRTGDVVAIMLERSLEMLIGVIAVLKAGSAYLPIAPDYPEERIQYMLADSSAAILLTTAATAGHIPFPIERINIEEAVNSKTPSPQTSIRNSVSSLAYIIYTSGSTGRPKGVLVEHRNVVRLVKQSDYIRYSTGDSLLMTGAFVFDVTTFEIWGPLLNGARLCIASKEDIMEAGKLERTLVRNKITLLHLIPQLFNQMAEQNTNLFAGLRYFLVGGDQVGPHWVNQVGNKHKQLKIQHMYGPTENTTFSTYFPVRQDYHNRIPIGKPLANSSVYIVDKQGDLVPVGVPGEISVGGSGVARGYLNNPELTAERFVENNWQLAVGSRQEEKEQKTKKENRQQTQQDSLSFPNNHLYRTGDLGKWLPDGTIEFLGRLDHQVKIRGIRIEIGEIENALHSVENIKEAVIQARKDSDGNTYLATWYVETAGQKEPLSISQLRASLSVKLPDYMIPAYFVPLETMPLTPNGKIDRKALPDPKTKDRRSTGYQAPANDTEKKLVEIWQQVLGPEPIGVIDNFFEIGG
ncbi:MAG: amino acid adenylation domain-containing protein, partial [bacterium]|nr:amino acid adenylation domain-containing protein [bacterium]